MKVAIAGCLHGELNRVYQDILDFNANHEDQKVDLLLVCGDFQSVRNKYDLKCMAVPLKFQQLGDFHEYYSGKRKAPILTLFIGGNHEASNYLATLPYGGWVAPNIYYMGYASVVNFGGLRIGAVSGIYKGHHAHSGHFERLPYDEDSKRSVYHTRDVEAYRMMQIQSSPENPQPLDIVMSHDWPLNIHSCGDIRKLLRMKPFFRQDVDRNSLGNPMYQPLVNHLKPRFWFSAHLHVKFDAHVQHAPNISTKFLALDKPIRPKNYLEIMDIPIQDGVTPPDEMFLSYDAEWLSILQKTNKFVSVDKHPNPKVPNIWITSYGVTPQDMESVKECFNHNLRIPENFEMCEPVLSEDSDTDPERVLNISHPQTTLFCQKLKITDPISLINNQNSGHDTTKNLHHEEDDYIPVSNNISDRTEANKRFKSDADVALASGQLFVIDKTGNQ